MVLLNRCLLNLCTTVLFCISYTAREQSRADHFMITKQTKLVFLLWATAKRYLEQVTNFCESTLKTCFIIWWVGKVLLMNVLMACIVCSISYVKFVLWRVATVLRHIFVHCDAFSSTFAAMPRPSCYIDNITK